MTVDLHQLEKDLKFLADSMAERYKKAQDGYTTARITASEIMKKAKRRADAFIREAERTRGRAAEDTAQADRALASIQGLRRSLEKELS
jgi:hypothetical protein